MTIVPGQIYQHYKGKYYKVIALAHHTETLEPCVVYEALYTDEKFGPHALWIRPLTMFCQEVLKNGKTIPRFQMVESII